MDSSKLDDELFERAISGYREAFLVNLAHLPETERNRLWTDRLTKFMPAPSGSSRQAVDSIESLSTGLGDIDGSSGTSSTNPTPTNPGSFEKLGKRTRQDASRPGPGLLSAKRRATVRLPGSLSSRYIPCFVPPVYLGCVPGLTVDRLRKMRLFLPGPQPLP